MYQPTDDLNWHWLPSGENTGPIGPCAIAPASLDSLPQGQVINGQPQTHGLVNGNGVSHHSDDYYDTYQYPYNYGGPTEAQYVGTVFHCDSISNVTRVIPDVVAPASNDESSSIFDLSTQVLPVVGPIDTDDVSSLLDLSNLSSSSSIMDLSNHIATALHGVEDEDVTSISGNYDPYSATGANIPRFSQADTELRITKTENTYDRIDGFVPTTASTAPKSSNGCVFARKSKPSTSNGFSMDIEKYFDEHEEYNDSDSNSDSNLSDSRSRGQSRTDAKANGRAMKIQNERNAQHPNAKPCEICGNLFRGKLVLRRHQIVIHGLKLPNWQQVLAAEERNNAKIPCDICGKEVAKRSLNIHMTHVHRNDVNGRRAAASRRLKKGKGRKIGRPRKVQSLLESEPAARIPFSRSSSNDEAVDHSYLLLPQYQPFIPVERFTNVAKAVARYEECVAARITKKRRSSSFDSAAWKKSLPSATCNLCGNVFRHKYTLRVHQSKVHKLPVPRLYTKRTPTPSPVKINGQAHAPAPPPTVVRALFRSASLQSIPASYAATLLSAPPKLEMNMTEHSPLTPSLSPSMPSLTPVDMSTPEIRPRPRPASKQLAMAQMGSQRQQVVAGDRAHANRALIRNSKFLDYLQSPNLQPPLLRRAWSADPLLYENHVPHQESNLLKSKRGWPRGRPRTKGHNLQRQSKPNLPIRRRNGQLSGYRRPRRRRQRWSRPQRYRPDHQPDNNIVANVKTQHTASSIYSRNNSFLNGIRPTQALLEEIDCRQLIIRIRPIDLETNPPFETMSFPQYQQFSRQHPLVNSRKFKSNIQTSLPKSSHTDFQCYICLRRFAHKASLYHHQVRIHRLRLPRYKQILERHQRLNRRKLQCTRCDHISSISTMYIHLKKAHNIQTKFSHHYTQIPLTESKLPEQIQNVPRRQRTNRLNGNRPTTSNHVSSPPKSKLSSQQLANQVRQRRRLTKVLHRSKISGPQCSICKQILSTDWTLLQHQVVRHGVEPSPRIRASLEKQKERVECTICGITTTRNNYSYHFSRRHVGNGLNSKSLARHFRVLPSEGAHTDSTTVSAESIPDSKEFEEVMKGSLPDDGHPCHISEAQAVTAPTPTAGPSTPFREPQVLMHTSKSVGRRRFFRKQGRTVRCNFCSQSFARMAVHRHLKTTHGVSRQFQLHFTAISPRLEATETVNVSHVKHDDVSGDRKVRCTLCNQVFTFSIIFQHLETVHKKEEAFYEFYVHEFGSSETCLQQELPKLSSSNWPCGECPKVFANRQAFHRHQKSEHQTKLETEVEPSRSAANGARCLLCNAVYSKHSIGRHISSVHKKFAELRELYKYTTDSPPKRFFPLSSTDLQCDVCSKVFGKRYALKLHRIRVHKLQFPGDEIARAFIRKIKGKVRCKVCGVLVTRGQIQQHVKRHGFKRLLPRLFTVLQAEPEGWTEADSTPPPTHESSTQPIQSTANESSEVGEDVGCGHNAFAKHHALHRRQEIEQPNHSESTEGEPTYKLAKGARCLLCNRIYHKAIIERHVRGVHKKNVKLRKQYKYTLDPPTNNRRSITLADLRCGMCSKLFRGRFDLNAHKIRSHKLQFAGDERARAYVLKNCRRVRCEVCGAKLSGRSISQHEREHGFEQPAPHMFTVWKDESENESKTDPLLPTTNEPKSEPATDTIQPTRKESSEAVGRIECQQTVRCNICQEVMRRTNIAKHLITSHDKKVSLWRFFTVAGKPTPELLEEMQCRQLIIRIRRLEPGTLERISAKTQSHGKQSVKSSFKLNGIIQTQFPKYGHDFQCHVCLKSLADKKGLRRHQAVAHQLKVPGFDKIIQSIKKWNRTKYQCKKCSRIYCSSFIYSHLKRKHNIRSNFSKYFTSFPGTLPPSLFNAQSRSPKEMLSVAPSNHQRVRLLEEQPPVAAKSSSSFPNAKLSAQQLSNQVRQRRRFTKTLHRSKNSSRRCPLCKQVLSSFRNLLRHQVAYHGLKHHTVSEEVNKYKAKVQCIHCRFTVSRYNYLRHFKQKHNQDGLISKPLEQHFKVLTSDDVLVDPLLTTAIPSGQESKEQEEVLDTSGTKFRCRICSRTYSRSTMYLHLKMKHGRKAPFDAYFTPFAPDSDSPKEPTEERVPQREIDLEIGGAFGRNEETRRTLDADQNPEGQIPTPASTTMERPPLQNLRSCLQSTQTVGRMRYVRKNQECSVQCNFCGEIFTRTTVHQHLKIKHSIHGLFDLHFTPISPRAKETGNDNFDNVPDSPASVMSEPLPLLVDGVPESPSTAPITRSASCDVETRLPWKCKSCSKVFTNRSSWWQHQVLAHQMQLKEYDNTFRWRRKVRCLLCRQIYSFSSIFQHLKCKHKKRKAFCDFYEFVSMNSLSEARSLERVEVKQEQEPLSSHSTDLSCTECPEVFANRHALHRHQKIKHPGKHQKAIETEPTCGAANGARCLICDKIYYKMGIVRHLRIVHKKNTDLKKLYKYTLDPSTNNRPHNTLDDLKCSVCARVFRGRFELNVHKIRSHKLQFAGDEKARANIRKSKQRVLCQICGAKVSRNNIQGHVRRRHGFKRLAPRLFTVLEDDYEKNEAKADSMPPTANEAEPEPPTTDIISPRERSDGQSVGLECQQIVRCSICREVMSRTCVAKHLIAVHDKKVSFWRFFTVLEESSEATSSNHSRSPRLDRNRNILNSDSGTPPMTDESETDDSEEDESRSVTTPSRTSKKKGRTGKKHWARRLVEEAKAERELRRMYIEMLTRKPVVKVERLQMTHTPINEGSCLEPLLPPPENLTASETTALETESSPESTDLASSSSMTTSSTTAEEPNASEVDCESIPSSTTTSTLVSTAEPTTSESDLDPTTTTAMPTVLAPTEETSSPELDRDYSGLASSIAVSVPRNEASAPEHDHDESVPTAATSTISTASEVRPPDDIDPHPTPLRKKKRTRFTLCVEDIGLMSTTCPICKESVPYNTLDIHKDTHVVACHICGMDVLHTDVVSHGITHVARLDCEECGHLFRQRHKLWEHMNRHLGKKPFLCSWCGTSFATQGHHRTHILMNHTNIAPFACNWCERRFTTRTAKRKHEVQHKEGIDCH